MKAIPDSLASMPQPLPFDLKTQVPAMGSMNESFAKNDTLIMRNVTADKERYQEIYEKRDIPVIPHSKLKILATENNLDNWKIYSKHAPRIPTAKDKQKQKDPYL